MQKERIKLRAEDVKVLTDIEEDVNWLENELNRAERAGLDVTDLRKTFTATKKMRKGLLAEYG